MLSSIGPLEIGIVLVIVLLIFGPKKLPELGSSLGRGIRDFGHGLKGGEEEPPAEAIPDGEAEHAAELREAPLAVAEVEGDPPPEPPVLLPVGHGAAGG